MRKLTPVLLAAALGAAAVSVTLAPVRPEPLRRPPPGTAMRITRALR